MILNSLFALSFLLEFYWPFSLTSPRVCSVLLRMSGGAPVFTSDEKTDALLEAWCPSANVKEWQDQFESLDRAFREYNVHVPQRSPKKPKHRFRPRKTSLQKRRDQIHRQMMELRETTEDRVFEVERYFLRQIACEFAIDSPRLGSIRTIVISRRMRMDNEWCQSVAILTYAQLFPCDTLSFFSNKPYDQKAVCVFVSNLSHRKSRCDALATLARRQGTLSRVSGHHTLILSNGVRIYLMTPGCMKTQYRWRGSSFGPMRLAPDFWVFGAAVFVEPFTVTPHEWPLKNVEGTPQGICSSVGIYSLSLDANGAD